MEINSSRKIIFHTEILPNYTKKALEALSKESWLEQSGWYLAGGTALALQAGNRKSIDLDFFTQEAHFESVDLLTHFLNNKDWTLERDRGNMIFGELLGAKISFIAYPFFIPKQEYIKYGSIKIIQPRDIAVMKIAAISQRGKKRDFFDLYWCAHHVESLLNIIKRLPEQYPSVAHDYHHILKAIVYFNDAEGDPDPQVNFNADWKMVKSFFEKEIPLIVEKLILNSK
ncbi:nucleotidyl transferase AbiEii/AbiGii toxin family protein [Candidatus Nomurabacteria bacterium]|nr:nucleotidyl transferase AbiEii/AbiGii toxin family protein [Candidatus Nomurabacteria bacterium]